MMKRLTVHCLTGLLAGAASIGHAQTALYVDHNHEFCLVRRVVRDEPYIDNGKGKFVRVRGNDYALRRVPEFAPYYVAIRGLGVSTLSTKVLESGSELNQRLEFRAEFESAYTLNNVFVVLELKGEKGAPALLVREVGRLVAREPKAVRISGELAFVMGRGQYQVHVYSEGTELFHTEMSPAMIEQSLDAMVKRRIAGVADADPKPFTGPAPEYPAKLRTAGVKGEVLIGFKISPTGRVLEPHIVEATDPSFGDAALSAARQWRFLPMVRDGRPRASAAEMPFVFEPSPAKPVGTSN